MSIQIALFRPQIPPNTGNIARLCVGLNLPLAIIGKAGFSMEEKDLQRAGLDYWSYLKFKHYQKYKDFIQDKKDQRVICISKEGSHLFWDFPFIENDILLFGNETAGLPPKLMKMHPISVRIPMYGQVRSLNLSNSVAIVAYEAIKKIREEKRNSFAEENFVKRMHYKKPSC